ncbi:hypothetical protein GCM10020358_75270 [Amorphoplanes nipponensis]
MGVRAGGRIVAEALLVDVAEADAPAQRQLAGEASAAMVSGVRARPVVKDRHSVRAVAASSARRSRTVSVPSRSRPSPAWWSSCAAAIAAMAALVASTCRCRTATSASTLASSAVSPAWGRTTRAPAGAGVHPDQRQVGQHVERLADPLRRHGQMCGQTRDVQVRAVQHRAVDRLVVHGQPK